MEKDCYTMYDVTQALTPLRLPARSLVFLPVILLLSVLLFLLRRRLALLLLLILA